MSDPIDVVGEEVAVIEVPEEVTQAVTLFGTDNPVEVIERASAIASALKDVIDKQGLTADIRGKKHVLVEGWTVLGSMIGIFPVLESCEPVEVDGVPGFCATVTAQTMNGNVIGKASAYCMRNEARWRSADTYAVASMAQTRATSKALRIPLGFIMQIAGYEVTPAAEMDGPGTMKSSRKTISDEPALLAELIGALDDNDEAPELWAPAVVLANAERKFSRKLDSLSSLYPEEAQLIIQGARDWKMAQPDEPEELIMPDLDGNDPAVL